MGKLCVLTKTNKETSNWLTGFFFLISFVMASFCGALVPSGGVKVQMPQCALQVKQHQGDKPGYEKHRRSLNTPQTTLKAQHFYIISLNVMLSVGEICILSIIQLAL